MKHSMKCVVAFAAVCGAMMLAADANAGRLQRGAIDMVTCVGEFPREIHTGYLVDGPIGVVTGTGRGIYYTVRRFGLGAWDVATFPMDYLGK